MKSKFTRHIYFIFLLAIALRLLWFFIVLIKNPAGFMLYDSWGYWRIAENIREFSVFSQGSDAETRIPDSVRTPLYPLFILFVKSLGIGFYGIIIIQILLSSLTCALTSFIAEIILKNKKAAFISGLLMVFDFPSVFFSNTIMTETLFTFLLTGSFALLIIFLKNRKKYILILSAILMGISILCRPVALFIPLLPGLMLLIQPLLEKKFRFQNDLIRINKKQIFILVIIPYLIITPWIVRNHITFGSPFISTISEVNLLFHTAAGIRAKEENKSLEQVQQEYREISAKNFDWKTPNEAVRFAKFSREEAWKVIQKHPITFLENYSGSLFQFFAKPIRNYIDFQLGIDNYESLTGLTQNRFSSLISKTIEKTSVPALFLVLFQVLMLLTLAALIIFYFIKNFKKLNFCLLIATAIIIYFAVFSSLTEVDGRMRLPVMPMICLLASAGAFTIFKNKIHHENNNSAHDF